MPRSVVGLFVLCLLGVFQLQETKAQCCAYRDPCVLQPCACAEVPSGIVSCASCNNNCNMPTSNALCNCGVPSCPKCFKDVKKPCNACEEKSIVCSCLKSLKSECGCEPKAFVYFPEVDYPMTVLEMNPFYYSTCSYN